MQSIRDHNPACAEASSPAGPANTIGWSGAAAVLDSVGQGVIVLDAALNVVLVNRPARMILKLPDTPLGRTLRQVLAKSPVLDKATAQALTLRCLESHFSDDDIILPMHGGGAHTQLRALADRHRALLLAPVTDEAASQGDPLTGLADKGTFLRALTTALLPPDTGAPETDLAVMSLDLGHFRSVNETLGRSFGDTLLCDVANRLRGVLRSDDVAARLSGGRFAVLAALGPERGDADALSHQVIERIGQCYTLDGHQVHVDARAGVAIAPRHGAEPAILIRRADLALRQARDDGRAVALFDMPMQARAEARRMLELDLRRALELDQFELHYQPLVNVACGGLAGFEALIRWRHPKRGLVPPNDFIPIAEEIGLISDLGAWVVREACREAARWPVPVNVSINASSAQFDGNHLVPTIAKALVQTGLPGHRLEVEVTESTLLRRDEATRSALHALRDMGIRIAMDDFGTGYSSLTQLQSFPFDKLKIDRSFVSKITESADSSAIVRAITRMGASLGLRTVAEGVETREQMEVIRAEGCDEVQGYLLSRPVPTAEISHVLARFGNPTA